MYFAGGDGVLHGVQVPRIQCCSKVGDCWFFQSFFGVRFCWSSTSFCFADFLCLCFLCVLFSDLRHCFVLLIVEMYIFYLCLCLFCCLLLARLNLGHCFVLPTLVFVLFWFADFRISFQMMIKHVFFLKTTFEKHLTSSACFKKHFSSGASTAPTFYVLTVWWRTRYPISPTMCL